MTPGFLLLLVSLTFFQAFKSSVVKWTDDTEVNGVGTHLGSYLPL